MTIVLLLSNKSLLAIIGSAGYRRRR